MKEKLLDLSLICKPEHLNSKLYFFNLDAEKTMLIYNHVNFRANIRITCRLNNTHSEYTYTMFALYQCGFSSACEDSIPVPVSPIVRDQTCLCRLCKTGSRWETCMSCILRCGWLTYLSLFGATMMSSLVGVYFGTWNHRSLCCGSTSHLKIIETNIRHSHQGRPLLAHHGGLGEWSRTGIDLQCVNNHSA